MPLYDYECVECGYVFELRRSFDSEPKAICSRCEGVSRRKFHPVPIIFKGSGFYKTDYKNGSFAATAKKETEADSTKEKVSETNGTSPTSKKEPEASVAANSGSGGSKDKSQASE